MALELPYETPYDVEAIPEAYYRVTSISADFDSSAGTVRLAVYPSKAARDARKTPIGYKDVPLGAGGSFEGLPGFDELLGMMVVEQAHVGSTVFDVAKAYVYSLLKMTETYSGAKDV